MASEPTSSTVANPLKFQRERNQAISGRDRERAAPPGAQACRVGTVEQAEDDDRREAEAGRGEISLKPRPWLPIPLRTVSRCRSRQRSRMIVTTNKLRSGPRKRKPVQSHRHHCPEATAGRLDEVSAPDREGG